MYIPNKESAAIFSLKEDSIAHIMQNMYTNIDFKLLEKFYKLYLNENQIKDNNLIDLYNKTINELKLSIKLNNKEIISSMSKQLSILQKAIDLKSLLELNFSENTRFYLP
jgi:hypothetical protein